MVRGRSYAFAGELDLPATLETGNSELVLIANGIASEPVRVRIK